MTNSTRHCPSGLKSVVQYSFARNWGLSLLAVLLQLFFIYLPIILGKLNIRQSLNFAQSFITMMNLFVIIPGSLILLLILAQRLLGFQHSFAASQMFYSWPLSRSKLFLSIQAVACSIILLPRLVNLVFYGILYGRKIAFLSAAVQVEAKITLLLLCSWFVLNLAYSLSVSSVQANLFYILLATVVPALILIALFVVYAMLPSFSVEYLLNQSNTFSGINLRFLTLLLGASPGIAIFLSPLAEFPFAPFFLYYLLATPLLAFAAWYCFGKRPLEKAGSSKGIDFTHKVLNIIVPLASALLLGSLFAFLRFDSSGAEGNSGLAFWVGIVAGYILSYLLLQKFLGQEPQKLKATLLSLLPSALVLALFLGVLSSGCWAWSSRIPTGETCQEILIFNSKASISFALEAESKAAFLQNLEQHFAPDNPGLAIPRDPSSRSRFDKWNEKQHGTAGDQNIFYSWVEKGAQEPASYREFRFYFNSLQDLAPYKSDPKFYAHLLANASLFAPKFSLECQAKLSPRLERLYLELKQVAQGEANNLPYWSLFEDYSQDMLALSLAEIKTKEAKAPLKLTLHDLELNNWNQKEAEAELTASGVDYTLTLSETDLRSLATLESFLGLEPWPE